MGGLGALPVAFPLLAEQLGGHASASGYLFSTFAVGALIALFATRLIASVLFGVGHVYQGVSGVVAAALGGLVYGSLYLWTGRNLWAPIIAHGVFDTTAFVLIFWGKYPGLQ